MAEMLIKNIIITIISYICLCIILIPFPILLHYKLISGEVTEKRIYIYSFIITGISIIVLILLCFVVGKKFLNNTNSILINILSLSIPTFLIALVIYISHIRSESYWVYGRILTIPIYSISEITAHFFRIEVKFAYITMSLLPALSMWVGMVTKRSS